MTHVILYLMLYDLKCHCLDGRELTDDELDYLNYHKGFILEAIERDWLDDPINNPRNDD